MTSQVDQATTKLIKHLLEKKKPDDLPTILCRRNFPYELKSPQWDPTWEGGRRVERGGKTAFELDPKYCLKINEDSTCYIHDLPGFPNNRNRLERISKETVTKKMVKKLDQVSGKFFDEEVVTVHRPEYERLTEGRDDMSDDNIQRIAKAVAEMLKPEAKALEEEIHEDSIPAQIAPLQIQSVNGTAPASPRGRGRPRAVAV